MWTSQSGVYFKNTPKAITYLAPPIYSMYGIHRKMEIAARRITAEKTILKSVIETRKSHKAIN